MSNLKFNLILTLLALLTMALLTAAQVFFIPASLGIWLVMGPAAIYVWIWWIPNNEKFKGIGLAILLYIVTAIASDLIAFKFIVHLWKATFGG